ncbi:hypothetical protein Tco_0991302 [Tanacetum coccineum]|uniref:Uncharacterized protein n=1 Tax=Tanacetum coccineum TaxID=301880 RepID=A0ABQ5EYW0_9ASTR
MSSRTSDVNTTSSTRLQGHGRAFWGPIMMGIFGGRHTPGHRSRIRRIPLQPVAPPSPDFMPHSNPNYVTEAIDILSTYHLELDLRGGFQRGYEDDEEVGWSVDIPMVGGDVVMMIDGDSSRDDRRGDGRMRTRRMGRGGEGGSTYAGQDDSTTHPYLLMSLFHPKLSVKSAYCTTTHTDIYHGARITIRPSLPYIFTWERLASAMALHRSYHHLSPPSSGMSEQPLPHKVLLLSTIRSRLKSDEEFKLDLTEQKVVPEIATMTWEKVNIGSLELAESMSVDTQTCTLDSATAAGVYVLSFRPTRNRTLESSEICGESEDDHAGAF